MNLANSQLSDLDELNLQLREKLKAAQVIILHQRVFMISFFDRSPHFPLHLQVEIEVQSEEISALSRAREAEEMETRKALQEKEQSFIEMEVQFKALRQGLMIKNISLTSQNLNEKIKTQDFFLEIQAKTEFLPFSKSMACISTKYTHYDQ